LGIPIRRRPDLQCAPRFRHGVQRTQRDYSEKRGSEAWPSWGAAWLEQARIAANDEIARVAPLQNLKIPSELDSPRSATLNALRIHHEIDLALLDLLDTSTARSVGTAVARCAIEPSWRSTTTGALPGTKSWGSGLRGASSWCRSVPIRIGARRCDLPEARNRVDWRSRGSPSWRSRAP